VRQRNAPEAACRALAAAGLHPVLARIYAARGVECAGDLESSLQGLLPPQGMKGLTEAANLLADAIEAEARLLIVADYDADGATACAVGVLGLQAMGARVDFLVPDRQRHGYGLTPAIVREAALLEPDLLITVDNGIASVEGVAEAASLGLAVLVTDHHLPGPALPAAEAIVNPNQPGCGFASKALAGVGVMFYVLLALRAELRARGGFSSGKEPRLADLLDLVALGTVADVVPLDRNNRLLVAEGLRRMRGGRARPGIAALFAVAGRDPRRASTRDLGFSLGPRLNAAGRLTDMRLGILCLLAPDEDLARGLAAELDGLNKARREIEADMREEALAGLGDVDVTAGHTVVAFDPGWHQGVIGIVAARLRDRFHRPTVVLAPGDSGELKGSGRSIAGLHLRDCLDLVAKREPDLLLRFGGHAAAAGLTLRAEHLERFEGAFEAAAAALMSPEDLQETWWADGELAATEVELVLAEALDSGVWGKDFPEPVFSGEFALIDHRVVGERHLRLKLQLAGRPVEAMLFGDTGPLPARFRALYQLLVNDWNGQRRPQLTIRHWMPTALAS
jgi:single-stranded-DNA-specific exonuclease